MTPVAAPRFRQKRWLRRLALLLAAAIVLVAAFLFWRGGAPYQSASWSPNGRYYIQKYSNFSISSFFPGAGRGSDSIDGYIRLYDKDGVLIHERFAYFIRDIEPVWAGNKVYLKGVAELDNDPWILPGASE